MIMLTTMEDTQLPEGASIIRQSKLFLTMSEKQSAWNLPFVL